MQMTALRSSALAWVWVMLAVCGTGRATGAELISVEKIWDAAPHNAFTDLVRWHDAWWCVFREGAAHVSPDGSIRVLTSTDGKSWESAARLTMEAADLRDAKLSITPDDRLMLVAAGALHQPAEAKHQTYVWFTKDGKNYTAPQPIGEPDMWMWRVVWQGDTAYGIGYATGEGPRFARLYTSPDGVNYQTHVDKLFEEGYPNETGLVFLPDEQALCLLRRDGNPASGQLGTSSPPYTAWRWTDLERKIGGPVLHRTADGRYIAVVRLYDQGPVRTAVCELEPATGQLTELLALPSGGDSSYAGIVEQDDQLWISYYSSHEGKTSIYLAKVKL